MVFSYVSDLEQIRPYEQRKGVEHISYRLFFIPIVWKVRYAQVKERRQTSEGPLRVGTTFLQITTMPSGISFETALEITAYEPPSIIVLKRPIPPNEVIYVFEPVHGGTKLTKTVKIAGGCYTLTRPFFAPLMKEQAKADLGWLKEILEAQPETDAC